jgi:putative protease
MAEILKPYQRDPQKIGNFNLFSPASAYMSKQDFGKHHLSIWVSDYESVVAAANAGADLIYAGGDELTGFSWNEDIFTEAIEKAHSCGARFVIGLPRINRESQRQLWEKYLQMALRIPSDGVIVSDLGTLQLVLQTTELSIYLNYTFNFFNSYALTYLRNPRIKQFTLSPELTLEQIREIRRHQPEIGLECLVQGPLELMVSEYCPLASQAAKGECHQVCRHDNYFLRDRLQLDFPVFMDQYCRLHLLNTKDLCLYSDLEKIIAIPNIVFRFEFKTIPANLVVPFISEYRRALKTISAGEQITDEELALQRLKLLSGRGITKGHYFRGVD